MKDRIPCADCRYCLPIGDGEGLCDFKYAIKDKMVVNLFEINPDCQVRNLKPL